ncbi:helix-turn-helix protein [compost metagenome]
MDLVDKIKNLMEQKNITQYKLAKYSGVPQTTLSKILNRETKNPRIDSIEAIAKYLDKPIDYFTQQEHADQTENKKEVNINDLLNTDAEITYNGQKMSEEDKKKLNEIMTVMFWDKKNKKK